MAFQLSGNTRTVPLPVVLQILQQAQVSGSLVVRMQAIEKSVLFKDGQIIFANSNDGKDRLGEILVKAGFLSRGNLEEGLTAFKKQGGLKKIGAILVENGFVSPRDLFAGFKNQVKEIIYSLFLWDDADYSFEEKLPADVIHLQINIQELITEIIERMKKQSE